jgi:hypothetical protein
MSELRFPSEHDDVSERLPQPSAESIESPLGNPREAYALFKAMRIDEYASAMDALDEFVGNLEMTDKDMTFERASVALAKAAEGFTTIDKNRDLSLTRDELTHYVDNTEGNISEHMEWLSTHFDALSRAGLFPGGDNKITKSDLETASQVFEGLAHIHSNFEAISNASVADGQITMDDLRAYLGSTILSGADRAAIYQLIGYVQRLENSHQGHGLTKEQLDDLSPEDLWDKDESQA